MPIISIIIPFYNRVAVFAETIASIKSQTNINWEVLIIDDGSDADEVKELNALLEGDNRFSIISRPDSEAKGAGSCRNIGLKAAQSKYVMFFDSDDLMLPDCIEYRLNRISEHPDYNGWVFQTGTFYNQLGDNDKVWNKLHTSRSDIVRFLDRDMPWHTSGPVWCRQFLLQNHLFFDESALSSQDWEYHIHALLKKPVLYKNADSSDSIHVFYRLNVTSGAISMKYHDPVFLKNRADVTLATVKDCALWFNENHQLKESCLRCIIDICTTLSNHQLVTKAMQVWKEYANFIQLNNIHYFIIQFYIYTFSFKKKLPIYLIDLCIIRLLNKKSWISRHSTLLKETVIPS